MLSILVIFIGLILLIYSVVSERRAHKNRYNYLAEFNKTEYVDSLVTSQQAVNLASLLNQSWLENLALRWENFKKQLGKKAQFKLLIVIAVLFAASLFFNQNFLRASPLIVSPVFMFGGLLAFYRWMQSRERKRFEAEFPDALNMMTSAVSSGESVMHAILYVGDKLEGDIGREFNLMGRRLQLGETPDEVFRKSCRRYPYSSFYFFVITLRANMQRGGQLKEVMYRLNRTMFNARAINKKKYALTSEARTSAKIVAAIPFFFLFILQFLSPENYEFVMFNDSGRQILYYVMASESIGIAIVWALMKSVR
ncbi:MULTISPECIES: type II secretion system F family protein [Vibrio]|uniref:Pilus assembly protein TadB n=2 Tax=Vibrio TaxID=662 RepID=A0A7X4LQQ8_9VIBR|nr:MULTISPECIES: type II secretion system F family protein [Vibrio]MBF9002229.1 type II secretion system F family protein [Vibrio nitrifigilis]MZI96016.1 pilus assembly protein TadB [Vibrio eleionomae]